MEKPGPDDGRSSTVPPSPADAPRFRIIEPADEFGTYAIEGPGVTEHSDGTFTVEGPGVTEHADGTVTLDDGRGPDGSPDDLGPFAGAASFLEEPAGNPFRLRTERLGTHAGVTFHLAVGVDPEHLDVDALAVGWNQQGPGRLGRWFLAGLGLEGFPGATQPDEPRYQPIESRPGSEMQLTSLRALILCTAQRTAGGEPRPPTIATVAVATKAAIRCAQSHRVPRLAISLLGAGDNGLPAPAVADAIVPAALIAASGLPPRSVQHITFLAPTAEEAASIRGAWGGFRPESFVNDAASGVDLLGVSDEVYALTEMLLLREAQPPVAVGVLGGWGSGKSFVMDLMRRRITEIRSRSIDPGDGWGEGASSYVGHVYPIDFNAWTFARADLWAALMQTVMQELDSQIAVERYLQAGDRLLDGRAWQELAALPPALRPLYALEHRSTTAEQSLFEVLRQIHREHGDQLRAAEEDLRAKEAAEAEARLAIEREVDAELVAEAAVKVQQQVEAPVTGAMRATAAVAAGWLERQVPELTPPPAGTQRTVDDLREAQAELRGLRLPPWRTAVAVVRRDPAPWLAALALLAVGLVAAWMGGLVLSWLPVVTILGAIGPYAKGARQIASEFSRQTERIRQDLQVELDAIEASRGAKIEQRAAEDEDLKTASGAAVAAVQQVQVLRARVGLVGEFTSADELVRNRLDQATYSTRLGAMQQISDDLRSLSDSLTIGSQDLHADTKKKELFPRGPARVVLFIDDLDRCPPAKVVEVLEAIQLLLSTGLFVVVVALDVRYVTRALENEYAGVLEADGEPSGLDYLEKIIQIPYRTRPGLGDAAATYIAGQLRVDAGDPTGAPQAEADTVAATSAATWTSAGAAPAAEPGASAETMAVARALTFTPADLEVIAEICRVLRLTPRAAKRVTNIVKLVRLVWARQGRYRPEVDDLATAALMVGLASAHPDCQRRAMLFLGGLRPGDAKLWQPLLVVLGELPPSPGTSGRDPSSLAWSRSIDALAALRFQRPVDGVNGFTGIGTAPVAQSMEIIEFVSAFCFISDSESI